MSEIASAPVTESAPSSTADVASQVIDSFEQTETTDTAVESAEPSTETPAAEATPSAEATAAAIEELIAGIPKKDIEALLGEFGFKDAKKPDGRDHYIPRPKVLHMIGTGLKRGLDKWTTERGVFEGQVRDLTGHLEQLRAAVMAEDTDAVIREFAAHNPKFARYLQTQTAAATEKPAADDPEPEPDFDLGNGQRTYSLDGLRKREDWLRRQLEKVVDQRLKPLTEREKAEEQRRQESERQAAINARTQSAMAEAQSWPGFGTITPGGELTPFQAAVLGKLTADSEKARAEGRRPSMTLREAYLEVRNEGLSTDETKVREKVIADLNNAPRSTATARSGEAPKAPTPASTQDIAARTLARLERGA